MSLPVPSFTDSVDYRFFLEPLKGVGPVHSYLDRFPDELYHKAPDTHFIRFMYTIMGPAGIGFLVQALLNLRLQLDHAGLENAQLDAFYGDPLSFTRTIDEQYSDSLSGLFTPSQWRQLKAQDENYRSRAIRYLHGARLGNTPQGMQLAAESGLGQNVEVVENYRALFDAHSDDPLGLPYYGSSYDLGEWIIRPRPAISRTVVVTIAFDDDMDVDDISQGSFILEFNGRIAPSLPWTATALDVASALTSLSTIGPGNALVVGGPIPVPFVVTFTGLLANQNLPPLIVNSDPNDPLVDATGEARRIFVTSSTGVIDAVHETVGFADADKYSMQTAIDNLRPVGTYPTFSKGRGVHSLQAWQDIASSSGNVEVVRYVTGSPDVPWPTIDDTNWIQPGVESEAPRLSNTLGNYVGFHTVADIVAHTDQVFEGISNIGLPLLFPQAVAGDSSLASKYTSIHVGGFTPEITGLMPFFRQFNNTRTIFAATNAPATYPQPLAVTGQTLDNTPLINNSYPVSYLGLQGVPVVQTQDQIFWASLEREDGSEILEIDLGTTKAVNFITFEITGKPIDIQINYDLIDQAPRFSFASVVPDSDYQWEHAVFYDPSNQSPWNYLEFHFNDGRDMIFTRYLQIVFTRRPDISATGRFLFNPNTQVQTPWSIDIRNLRIGRNVAPSLT